MKMLLDGQWVDRPNKLEVRNPQDNTLVDTVPLASTEDMRAAIRAAEKGFEVARNLPTHARMAILNRAADYIATHHEDYARTIAAEGIKTIREARKEVTRCIDTLRLSAEEARRIAGETIPFDQRPDSNGRLGYYQREPIGIIGAITPFNDPLNLVAHKCLM